MLKTVPLVLMLGGSLAFADGNLAVRRTGNDGTCNLVVMTTNAPARTTCEIRRLLQYDPDRGKWIDRTKEIPAEKRTQEIEPGTANVLAPITHRVGLLWLEWQEGEQMHSSFVYSGPVLCNDVELGPPQRSDLIAQCIPGTNSALAAFVPDPRKLKTKDK